MVTKERNKLVKQLFSISKHIRYVAIYSEGNLSSEVRSDLKEPSSPDTDRYEELLVNPTLLLLTKQRGDIDCGGCRFVLVRYGNFFQLIRSAGSKTRETGNSVQ